MEPLLDIDQAAELLGLSSWTVRKLIAKRRLRPVRINRRVLLEPEELRRIVEEAKGDQNLAPGQRGSASSAGIGGNGRSCAFSGQ